MLSALPELWERKESRRRADQEDRRVSEEHTTVGTRDTMLGRRGMVGRLILSGVQGAKLCGRLIRPGLGKSTL